MERIPFGRTGHHSSRVIFGAAALGSMRQAKADALLDLLLEFGVNHVDTAAAYGDSELRIGPWMERHRDRFFLATKTGERSAAGARASLERSRERLRADVIDLVQLHNLVDEAEWEAALDRLLADPALLARWSPAAVEAMRPYWTENVAIHYRRLFVELADGSA